LKIEQIIDLISHFLNYSVFVASVDYNVTKKGFGFAKKHRMPFYFVSASDGTNVVKVRNHVAILL